MKKQEGFISIILTVIITALLVGGGTYYVSSKNVTNKISTAVTETGHQYVGQIQKLDKKIEELEVKLEESIKKEEAKNSDWQTYKNDTYEYSIQYPSDWSLDSIRTKGDEVVVFNYDCSGECRESISVIESTKTLIDFQDDFIFDESVIEQILKTTIVGQEAYHIYTTEFGLQYIITKQNNKIYTFTTQGAMKNDGILETFKFLDDDIADWEREHLTLGFIFKHPAEFSLTEDNDDSKLFTSEGGHFWVKIYDNEEGLSVQEIKEDYYSNDTYGYQYEDTFPAFRQMETYKQGRYDLGVIEKYYIPHSSKIFEFNFEFNFDTPDETKSSTVKALIYNIMNTIGVVYN
jgi:hypothetical protein